MNPDRYALNKLLVKKHFNRAAPTYDHAAVLQREVADRMLERLDLVRLTPAVTVDVGCGTGHAARRLTRRYRQSRVIGIDLAGEMLKQAQKRESLWQRWRRRCHWCCADAEHLPLATGSVDLLFTNLTLQWCPNLDAVFREFHRVLRDGGLLMFSTLGPDTLTELRQSWRQVDDANHVSVFMDMHDVGDALVRHGFATPVMDVEHFTLTYPDVHRLMRDLKAIGAQNATQGGPRGLTGKSTITRLAAAYEAFRRNGTLPATYEIVYGHGWKAAPDQRLPRPPSMAISLDELLREQRR